MGYLFLLFVVIFILNQVCICLIDQFIEMHYNLNHFHSRYSNFVKIALKSGMPEEAESPARQKIESGEDILREGLRRTFLCEIGGYWVEADQKQEFWEEKMEWTAVHITLICAAVAAHKSMALININTVRETVRFEEQVHVLWKEHYLQRNSVIHDSISHRMSMTVWWDRHRVHIERQNMTARWVDEQDFYSSALITACRKQRESFASQLLELSNSSERKPNPPTKPIEPQQDIQRQPKSVIIGRSRRLSSGPPVVRKKNLFLPFEVLKYSNLRQESITSEKKLCFQEQRCRNAKRGSSQRWLSSTDKEIGTPTQGDTLVITSFTGHSPTPKVEYYPSLRPTYTPHKPTHPHEKRSLHCTV